MDVGEIANRVGEVVEGEADVVLAYLFGSTAAGARTPLSDVDVAVMVRAGVDADVVCGRLMDALVRSLKTERIDLVRLDRAPPPLGYRIVRDGRLLVCRDEKVRQRYVSRTVMRYLDFKPLRDRAFETARKAALEASTLPRCAKS